MTDALRWAARYEYFESLWRGRARLILDPDLERVLLNAGPGVAHGSPAALKELVDRLLPASGRAPKTWMIVGTRRAASELRSQRRGTTFVPLAELEATLRGEPWEHAWLNLTGLLEGESADDVPPQVDESLQKIREIVQMIDLADGERSAVIVVPSADYPRAPVGVEYEAFAELVEEVFDDGRMLATYTPEMTAVVEFGDDEDDDIPLGYDNVLASESPALRDYMVVVGPQESLADLDRGMSLIELPDIGAVEPVAQTLSAYRAQLVQLRQQAERAGVERQRNLERISELERQNAEMSRANATPDEDWEAGREVMRQELDTLRNAQIRWNEQQADYEREIAELQERVVDLERVANMRLSAAERLDALVAREQALRLEVRQLKGQLAELVSRPPSELEAEVAHLRARLEANLADVEPPPESAGRARVNGMRLDRFIPNGVVRRDVGKVAVAAQVERLVHRLERGGVGTLELRAELQSLRRRLVGT
jgi:hypothetical protein